MNKFCHLLTFILLTACASRAQQKITANITITNRTSNGLTFTLNGDTRTWTNSVVNSATQVLTNSDATGCGSKTNLLNQIYAAPFASVVPIDTGSNSFKLIGNANLAMNLSFTAGYMTASYATQTVSSLTILQGPVASLPTAIARTNAASDIVGAVNAPENTNQISQTSTAAAQLIGTTNTQTISGQKTFNNTNDSFTGSFTGATALSGNVLDFTNGYWTNATADHALVNALVVTNTLYITNGTFVTVFTPDGAQMRSNTVSPFDFEIHTTNGFVKFGTNNNSGITCTINTRVGSFNTVNSVGGFYAATGLPLFGISGAGALNASNIVNYGTMSVSGDASFLSDAIFSGNIGFSGVITNGAHIGADNFLQGADIAFARFPVSSLTAGANAAVPVGTNEFIEVSGPGGAFSIDGIANGRDGKVITILNQTGQQMTIANESGSDPTPANRIRTLGSGANLVLTNAMVELRYSAAASRWIVSNHNP